MKKSIVLLLVSVFVYVFSMQNASAQTPVSDVANVYATIITPLTISKQVDLSFGNIVAATTAGSVTVATDGTRSKTGAVTLPVTTPGTITAAEFKVDGLANATYSIEVPASAFNVTSGANTMSVGTFVTNPTPTGTLNASGTQTIKVGATITVGANQAAGNYENTTAMEITVAYN